MEKLPASPQIVILRPVWRTQSQAQERRPTRDGTLPPRSLPHSQFSPRRAAGELVLISLILLFLELSCIRWFPPTVPDLTFLINTVLLAYFLGMSLGCLAARWSRNLLIWTPK